MSTQGAIGSPAAALFPKTRRAILGLLYAHPDETYYLRQIVEMTDLGVGQVQRELKILTGAGVLARTEHDRHVYFGANHHCPIYEELRGLVAKTVGVVDVLREALGHLEPRIAVAFVFGSVARSEETSNSDLDLMVIGDCSFFEIADAVRAAEPRLNREINPSVYPVCEMRSKIQAGHHFLKQVLERDKLFVIGEARELAALLDESVDTEA